VEYPWLYRYSKGVRYGYPGKKFNDENIRPYCFGSILFRCIQYCLLSDPFRTRGYQCRKPETGRRLVPGGNFMFEFYHKPDAVGSFASLNHSAGHVAFASDDADALSKKMQQGGAKIVDTTTNPVGDTVINMTDPWGNALQVIHRVKPKLK